jgi:signal transduction histidine kinase
MTSRNQGATFRSRLLAKSSLRTQLLLTTVLPVTGLLIVLSLVAVIGLVQLTRTLVQERDSQLVQLASRQVASYLSDSVLLLTQVAANDDIRSGDPQASLDILNANLSLAQRFDQIALTDPNGGIAVATGDVTESLLINQPWIERARRLRRPILSPVFLDSQGRQMLCVAIPVYDNAGAFRGCAVGIWDLASDRLGRPIASVRVGETGIAYLVDSDGTILYHPVGSLIGTNAAQDPAYSAFKQRQAGSQTINIDGALRVIGYAPIPLQQLGSSLFADESWSTWNLVTSESLGDIVAPLQPYLPFLILLVVLVVALPLTIITISSHRIAAPLQSLATQAGHIASGEFGSQVTLTTGPLEVRELEEAFNTMVEQLRSYRGDIQNYVVSILNSQEQERKRIARELHDETAQALIVLGRRIEAAQELTDLSELARELEALRDMVDDTLQGVRSFTSDLRPPLLGELGLPRTLQLLGDRTEREEPFTVTVDITGQAQQLAPELELGLYRLAQESLSNVRRHAHAKHVHLSLRYEAHIITLEVIDDGIGFEPPANLTELLKTGRLGLMGIYERARLFGGRAHLSSRPGGGTTVRVVIPIGLLEPESLGADENGAHSEGN